MTDHGSPVECCSFCLKPAGKLKKCKACKSVRYCNADCQRSHWKVHKNECKRIQTEMSLMKKLVSVDDDMFDPIPPNEDCPICFLPLPVDTEKNLWLPCCGKILCYACFNKSASANRDRNMETLARNPSETKLIETCCPFCRKNMLSLSKEEFLDCILDCTKHQMKLNDPLAFLNMAKFYTNGLMGLPIDDHKAFVLYQRSADLGLPQAHRCLSGYYLDAIFVKKDVAMGKHHLKIAATGCVESRRFLGDIVYKSGNTKTAMKHWEISASAGCNHSLERIRVGFMDGDVSKDIYEKCLRANQTVLDAEKSDARHEFDRHGFDAEAAGDAKP